MNNTARYIDSGLGVAVMTTCLDPATPQSLLHSWTTPVVIGAAVSVLAGLLIPLLARSRSPRSSRTGAW